MTVTKITPAPFAPGLALQDGSALNAALAADASSVSAGLVAAGNSFATALQLTSVVNQFATVAAGQGAILQLTLIPGGYNNVYNDGASPLTVYAPLGWTIDGVAGAVGVPLANAKRCNYTMISPGVIESAQLGAVSA